jgi:acylphosphatase
MPQRLFTVRGQVQGVGFRWWTRTTARRLGVTGTVRNCPDGTVEIRASGDEAALAELRSALREGPPVAEVDAVEEGEAVDVPTGEFRIVD